MHATKKKNNPIIMVISRKAYALRKVTSISDSINDQAHRYSHDAFLLFFFFFLLVSPLAPSGVVIAIIETNA